MVKGYTTTKSMAVPDHPARVIDILTEKTQIRILAANPRACSDIQQSQQSALVALGRRGQGPRQESELPLPFLPRCGTVLLSRMKTQTSDTFSATSSGSTSH